MAAYSGDQETQFFYADAAWSLSMSSADLEPGVDCPEGAHFLPVTKWISIMEGGFTKINPLESRTFYPVCVFEWKEDHTIWRHMENSASLDVRGLVRQTVVVRTVCTVGNYDYITDIKLREDGEIEVKTRFAGYIEARHFDPKVNPEETNFSTIIRPDLAGPVHSHLVNWKADFDIAGVRGNSFQTTKVKAAPLTRNNLARIDEPLISKYLERAYVAEEGVGKSTFVAHPQHPTTWAIVDRNSKTFNPRGYAIALASWSTTQVLPDEHPFVKAMPLTKYHLAVTKQHDHEYRSSSVYAHYDGLEKEKNPQDIDHFLSDGESLLDEDLVAWIGVGREHIVRQEDLPLVSNFGAGFHIVPWNFFSQNVAASPPWEE
jgi:Cu2+-containing amine oxidase